MVQTSTQKRHVANPRILPMQDLPERTPDSLERSTRKTREGTPLVDAALAKEDCVIYGFMAGLVAGIALHYFFTRHEADGLIETARGALHADSKKRPTE
jgi:hypothetical protein